MTGGGVSEKKGEESGDAINSASVFVTEFGGKYFENGWYWHAA